MPTRRRKPSRATKIARERQIEPAQRRVDRTPNDSGLELWHEVRTKLVGDLIHSPSNVSEITGVPLERLRELWRALGFPPVAEDTPAFSDKDIEILAEVGRVRDNQDVDKRTIVQFARVAGQALARLAETEVELALGAAPVGALDDLKAIESRLGATEPFLVYIWRRHLLAALARKVVGPRTASSDHNVLAVGFADLVGFSELSRYLESAALAELVEHFEQSVYAAVPQNGGRVIKMLGDEVMFAVERSSDAIEIALALIDLHEADPVLPEIRVGLASGPMLSWEGDLFGSTVNLASRLSEAARPSTVLIPEDVAEELGEDDYRYQIGRSIKLKLKGMGAVRAHRVQRREIG